MTLWKGCPDNKEMTGNGAASLIPFLVEHNTSIISALVLGIILLSLVLGFRGFFAAKQFEEKGGAGEGPSLGQLEDTLKKLLEKANTVPLASSVEGASPESTNLLREIEDLRNSLAEKQVQIEMLERASQATGASAVDPAGGLSSGDKATLEKQIKDLQSRLSEYEIISEDIADLSFFREENAKLKAELDAVKKSGGAVAPAPAAAAAPSPAPVAPTPELDQVDAVAQALEKASQPEPTAEVDLGQDMVDKLLEEMQSKQDQMASGTDDGSAIAGEMDVDKMVSEAAALTEEPAAEVNALEGELNPDKLLEEADSMTAKVSPEDARLMGEFEDFMKKGGVG